MTNAPKIVFLGSNPSNASPFLDPFTHCRSAHVLSGWVERLGLKWDEVKFANVANYKTSGNKPLTGSQISAEIPRLHLELNGAICFALGSTAIKAARKVSQTLTHVYPHKMLIIELPHPSGMNRLLNDKDYVTRELARAKRELAAAILILTQ